MSLNPFAWNDGQTGLYGEGLSRPKHGAKVKSFKLLVRQGGSAPMRVTTKAESASAAVRYMQSRWPGAAVEVVQ